MFELTFDREARALYCYFTEITEGDDANEWEVPGVYLLDAAGQLVGVRVELGEKKRPKLLEHAQQHEGVAMDEVSNRLTLTFAANPVASEEELPYGAVIDVDAKKRALGLEIQSMIEFDIEPRLEALAPLLVDFDEEFDADADDAAADDQIDSEAVITAAQPRDQRPRDPGVAATLSDENVRSGFVALIGKPNVGKSTLLNAYLGQKVSIVSPKPQTTRVPVRGILNGPEAQIVFVDTPGIHQPRHKLGSFMVDMARRAIPNADVLCFVVDISVPPSRQDREIAEMVLKSRQPHILVLNKVDATREADLHLRQYRHMGEWECEVAVSAKNRLGLETLLEEITARLPIGPRLYPEDQLSDMSERELVSEMIREKVMLNTEQEIPHSVAVEVEEWEDRDKAIYIRANISVEKESQKGIVIGAGGVMLKKIGAAARYEIERSLGQHVFLDLWVKVRENWRQKPNELRWLGYDVKFFKG
ncbi:MAG: GTPase Era [Herpetosiphonaceae bacterium]|nr:GTPase Era [Herpetosiphonaceae bacterium]